MSGVVVNQVRRGFYMDSVGLMRMSRAIAGMDGVAEAAMMMGTPANLEIMAEAGILEAGGVVAGGGDLVIGVRAAGDEQARAALAQAVELLDRPAGAAAAGEAWRPRSIRGAVAVAPDSNLALISAPGDFAAAEARKALRRGLHAMIFSDNVTLADEIALKREARERGLLVMGPDCGTAIINGAPLAFANRVTRGDIGIVAASGTGAQEVSCLVSRFGGGISHLIGVGGRDLTQEVGGISTLMALEALDRDPATRHVVLISKPPAASVAAEVLSRIAASQKAFTVCFLGAETLETPANASLAATLKAAAQAALGAAMDDGGDAGAMARPAPPGRTEARGLYCGGTLCAEAQVIFRRAGEAVRSNAPIPGAAGLEGGSGHRLIDLGDEAYTRGRPHPMIDPAVRDAELTAALGDPAVGVLLVDVVIGQGAHGDPAGWLADAISAPSGGPVVIASVTGTEEDPQGLSAQRARLAGAGVLVASCNADAAALALACLRAGR